MSLYTVEELKQKGLVRNPNMYLGSAYFFCKVCEKYTYHYAMSNPGKTDLYSVCRECNCYSK